MKKGQAYCGEQQPYRRLKVGRLLASSTVKPVPYTPQLGYL